MYNCKKKELFKKKFIISYTLKIKSNDAAKIIKRNLKSVLSYL